MEPNPTEVAIRSRSSTPFPRHKGSHATKACDKEIWAIPTLSDTEVPCSKGGRQRDLTRPTQGKGRRTFEPCTPPTTTVARPPLNVTCCKGDNTFLSTCALSYLLSSVSPPAPSLSSFTPLVLFFLRFSSPLVFLLLYSSSSLVFLFWS